MSLQGFNFTFKIESEVVFLLMLNKKAPKAFQFENKAGFLYWIIKRHRSFILLHKNGEK